MSGADGQSFKLSALIVCCDELKSVGCLAHFMSRAATRTPLSSRMSSLRSSSAHRRSKLFCRMPLAR